MAESTHVTSAVTTSVRLRSFASEFIGTLVLVMVVVGSGIMGTRISRDTGIALGLNAASTVLALGLLIWLLAPASGAHFNPVVSAAMVWRGDLPLRDLGPYVVSQSAGAIAGAGLANLMYGATAFEVSATHRDGTGVLIGEVVATAGLLWVICSFIDRGAGGWIPVAVPAWIGSAYLFTSSTSFANPAVTVGRIFSDSFAGIAPASVPAFAIAQCIGAGIGIAAARFTTVKESVT
ncbi:MAG: aquaporin family protein [Actinobacteria bacterium]|nr:aquaporin family protein [Actinomycetota bacterium]